MTFAVYEAAEGGPGIWTETQHLALTDGYYATFLGTETAFPAGLFDGRDLYLEVRVEGDALVPRQRIGSVAYALLATDARNVVGGAVSASSVSVGGRTIIDRSGRLVGEGAVTAGPGIEVDATNTVALRSGCGSSEVLAWDGADWVCAAAILGLQAQSPLVSTGGPDPSLSLRPCPAGQILESDGSGWACGADDDTIYTDADAVAAVAATDAYVTRSGASTVTGALEIDGPLTVHGGAIRYGRASFSRDGAYTIHYTAPNGATESLNLGNGTTAMTGSLIAFRPGGSADSTLYFNIESSPSIACTLLHNEDDSPVRGYYFATDAGNGMGSIWGNTSTSTFMLRVEGATGHVIGTNRAFGIVCF